MRKTYCAIAAAGVLLAGCGSLPEDDAKPDDGTTEEPTTERSLEEPVSIEEPSTTVERTTTTETPTTVSAEDTSMLVISLVMCSTYPDTDAAFGLDWCAMDPSGSVLEEMVGGGCDLIEAIDPYDSLTDDEIIEQHSLLAVDSMASGDATFDEVSVMATMNGAILSVRDEVC